MEIKALHSETYRIFCPKTANITFTLCTVEHVHGKLLMLSKQNATQLYNFNLNENLCDKTFKHSSVLGN